jgi:hypothetical protein
VEIERRSKPITFPQGARRRDHFDEMTETSGRIIPGKSANVNRKNAREPQVLRS